MPAHPPAEAPIEVFAACAEWLMVIGGTAVQAYGADRMTFDCDCAILEGDEPRLAEALEKLGYIRDTPQPNFFRYHHLSRRRPVVDAMRLNAQIEGWTVRLAAPLHLVAMKLHALKQNPERAFKDWPDILHLLHSTRGEWSEVELRELVERYASEDTTAQLRKSGLL